jgi:uncharacterized repeat protein (TIGR01451 family)
MSKSKHAHRSMRGPLGAVLICAIAALALPAAAEAATIDLSVSQGDIPDPARNGETVTYVVRVTNGGPDAAHAVRLVDKLSSRVNFVAASSPRPSASCAKKGRRVICSLGRLGAGNTATVNIQVVPALAREQYTIFNFVSVVKRNSDPNLQNNTAREQTAVVNPPPVICGGRRATIVGTDGDDALIGTDGPDVIATLSGNDSVIAQGGDDVVCGSGGRDVVRAGGGADRIKGGGAGDRLAGGDGNDRLLGKNGRDKLGGGRGKDVMRGGRGKDRCRGGAGKDIRRSC